MSWRLAITHVTEHRYPSDVLASYNEARITPGRSDTQLVLEHRIDVTPAVRVLRYFDYWGTEVCAFDVHEPHAHLTVAGRSVVETGPGTEIAIPASWSDLSDANCRDQHHEFLSPSRFVPSVPAFADLVPAIVRGCEPVEAVRAIAEWTHAHLAYDSYATTVATTAPEALALGRGVCQDYVHVALALLRAAGIPGRYASGYLHPHTEPALGETVAAESHAWFEAWVGGWLSMDPTNGAPVAGRHVLVARGRDYGDVTPLKGVYHGPPSEQVDVRVEITRVA